jgi:hypothetical protein
MFARNRIAILMAEFLGTGMLALVMLSVQHSTIGLPYFVALAAGLALAVATAAVILTQRSPLACGRHGKLRHCRH